MIGAPYRYVIREEIEKIIKELNIDRIRFHEYSKDNYVSVIKGFYYTFVDYIEYPYNADSSYGLAYRDLHFRNELKKVETIQESPNEWLEFLRKIKKLQPISADKKLILILGEGWVYEGYIDEIIDVLSETDAWLSDFYITSHDYEWVLCYCEEGYSAVLYFK